MSAQDRVIIDETGSRINMTPLYAYAPGGERAIGKVARNDGANLTLIASLSLSGMGEALLLDGSADAGSGATAAMPSERWLSGALPMPLACWPVSGSPQPS